MYRHVLWRDKKSDAHDVATVQSCEQSLRPAWGFLCAPPEPIADPRARCMLAMDGKEEVLMSSGLLTMIEAEDRCGASIYISSNSKLAVAMHGDDDTTTAAVTDDCEDNDESIVVEKQDDTFLPEEDEDEEVHEQGEEEGRREEGVEEGKNSKKRKAPEEEEEGDGEKGDGEKGAGEEREKEEDEGEDPKNKRRAKHAKLEMMAYLDFGEYIFDCVFRGESHPVWVRSYRVSVHKIDEHRIELWGPNIDVLRGLMRSAWRSQTYDAEADDDAATKGVVALWAPSRDSSSGKLSWSLQKHLVKRPSSTLVFPSGQLEDIVSDVRRFLKPETRQEYARVGMHYRRGYLLHGLSGAGKSSLVHHIATEFDIDVFNMPLSLLTGEEALTLFKGSRKRILLIEEIDAAFSKDRKRSEASFQFSVLLNALSSVGTEEGMLIFMTTNDRAALDDALIRPGRIDYEMEFKKCTQKQTEALVRLYAPKADDAFVAAVSGVAKREVLTPALIQKAVFHQDHSDPEKIVAALEEMAKEEAKARETRANLYS
jgi:hypothetical protein